MQLTLQQYKWIRKYLGRYPTPLNISYLWNFGSLSGIMLIIQIITGVCLAMHYAPNVDIAFFNIEYIMRELESGWLLRYLHSNGASMFFLIVLIHIGRNIYYGSYAFPRTYVWVTGMTIFILMIATAFLGYVLPWGQMSFWAATVITNLFSAIPIIGTDLVQWLWGGYSVGNPTLNRFFSLHYVLPFVLIVLSLIHLIYLNISHSGNPLGIKSWCDYIPFSPYFIIKDIFGASIFFFIYLYFVFFNPNILGHSINYVKADPCTTPAHIVPEWYFLFLYGVLRSIPDKLGGVIALAAIFFILYLLAFISKPSFRGVRFKPHRIIYWLFILIVIFLSWIGSQPIEPPYLIIGQILTISYFILISLLFYNYNQKI